MKSGKVKVRDREKAIMVLVAIFLTVVLIPSTIRSSLFPESITYTKLIPLYAVGPSQQMVTVSISRYPYTGTISFADTLSLAYNYTEGLGTGFAPIISLPDSTTSPGSNITFLVKPWLGIASAKVDSLAFHVFLVDPEGIVRVTYPRDDLIDLTFPSSYRFSQQWSVYDTEVMNAFRAGTLALTAKVDDNDLSVGTWRIFAFVTGTPQSTQSYGQVSTLGGSVASFNVAVPPQYLSFVPVVTGYLGSILAVFQLETYLLITARGFKGTLPSWLRDNSLLLAGMILIVIYLYLGYFPLSS